MGAERGVRSATRLAADIRAGRVSPTEAVETCLDRIERLDGELNAFITVTAERARKAARRAERELADGEPRGPLHGVPVAIKDSRPVAGVRYTMGSKLLADEVADEDDEVVGRLRDAGAIVVGKTNLPAFALTGVTDNRLVGPTANPFDHEKVVGGSSGGSAAAVAAGLVPVAQGEDGGGSLRIPASTCGVYTMKPTFGRIGEMAPNRPDAFGHTPMQCAGPLTRTVDDAALLLDVLAGPHPGDPSSLPAAEGSLREATDDSIAGLDVAVSPNLGLYPIDERVRETVLDAVTAFEEAGASVREVTPDFDHSRTAITNAFMLQSSVLTARFGELLEANHGVDVTGADREDLLPYVADQFEAGHEPSAMEYKAADVVRTAVLDTVRSVFEEFDLLVSATLMVPPFEKSRTREHPGPLEVDGTRLDDSRWGTLIDWRATQIYNMTGHPAASIPAGFVDGLPVGMQVAAPRFEDATLIAASAAFERERPWHDAYEDRQ
ncbi:amidase [Haloarculaceae archaeon H-GB2-1]|nr:amidase [Haloarculaceae archaeon H-GB2-1]